MFRTFAIAILELGLAGFVVPSSGGILLTSDIGYTGPVLDLSGFANGHLTYTNGPISLPRGITFTSNPIDPNPPGASVLGQGDYYLTTNGGLYNAVYVGLNAAHGYMTFAFASPVQEFGAFMNYAPFATSGDPIISALDSSGNVLDSFDLALVAPISTPGVADQFKFRGISENLAVISGFRLGGSNIVATGTANGSLPVSLVPEPGSLVLFGLGLAGIGFLSHYKRRDQRLHPCSERTPGKNLAPPTTQSVSPHLSPAKGKS